MKSIKQHPRPYAILGAYVLMTFICIGFLGGLPVMLLGYLALTMVLIGVFFSDCAAMLGNIRYGMGKSDEAAKLFKFAVSRHTKSPQAHLNYAVYLLRRGHAADASALLDKAEGLKPAVLAQKSIILARASCLYAQGDIDGAIAVLEQMKRTFEYVNAQVQSTLAYMYYLKGDIEQAESLSRAAIEDTEATPAAWDNLGQIHYIRKEWAEAKTAFEKALEYKADLPDSHYYLGLIARETGDETEATARFERALACTITPLNTITREQIEAALGRE